MTLTLRFDLSKLIEEKFPWHKEWYIEMTDAPFLPKKGTLATIDWDDFIVDKELLKYLKSYQEGVRVGKITEMIYKSDLNIVYVALEEWVEEPRKVSSWERSGRS